MEDKLLKSVFNLLVSAGDKILEIYNSNHFRASLKADNSPVTEADKNSSRILNQGLNKLFPEIPVLDEETEIPDFETRKKWNRFFLVDPLDGTKEFIKKNGEFCINLALIQNNSPVIGWIYQPTTGVGWFCEKGAGIYEFNRNGNFEKLEHFVEESEKIRIVTSRSFFKPREEEIIDKIARKYPVEIIHKGSSIKQIAMVLGKADMYMKAGPCSEWDTAPGQLMVEEFGGAVLCHSNFEPMKYNKPVLANPFFVMLNSKLNTPDFKSFLQEQIHN